MLIPLKVLYHDFRNEKLFSALFMRARLNFKVNICQDGLNVGMLTRRNPEYHEAIGNGASRKRAGMEAERSKTIFHYNKARSFHAN